LRGIAALSVVLCHLTALFPQKNYGFKFGITGVDLFFILSGFVILLTLDGKKSSTDFLISRFSRLFPAYWAAVSLTTMAVFLQHIWKPETELISLTRYLANLSMMQLYLKSVDIDVVYWTLVIELSFYAGMLILFQLKGLKYVEGIGFASLPLAVVFHSEWMKHDWSRTHDFLSNWLPIVSFYPLFLAGICFYRIRTEGVNIWRYGFVALCYGAQLELFFEGGNSRFNFGLGEYSAILAFYFLLFMLFAHNRLHFLINSITLFLGRISYSLYLCHHYIGRWVIMPYLIDQWGFGFWSAFSSALLVVLCLAYLINRFIEAPSILYIRGLWYSYNSTPRLSPNIQQKDR